MTQEEKIKEAKRNRLISALVITAFLSIPTGVIVYGVHSNYGNKVDSDVKKESKQEKATLSLQKEHNKLLFIKRNVRYK